MRALLYRVSRRHPLSSHLYEPTPSLQKNGIDSLFRILRTFQPESSAYSSEDTDGMHWIRLRGSYAGVQGLA